jgi:hypothetical protein
MTRTTKTKTAAVEATETTAAPIIALHLDLKGVMFRPAYIPQLLADLRSQGINTVLVEYEDIFPFDGLDIAFDNSVKWSKRTLRRFLDEAAQNDIEVIPLQQCLGHLEYLFRWDSFRRFALDYKYPSTLDVNSEEGNALIHNMLRQVIEAHPNSRYVHLGMDEAHALVAYAEQSGREVVAVFLEHLEALCQICEEYGKKPIIWSDMFEDHITPASLALFEKYKDRVVMCPWDYGASGERIGVGRIAGMRASRKWLDTPDSPEAPALGAGTTWIEEMPAPVRKLVAEYIIDGRFFVPMFQADLWSKLGFEVLGASAVRNSATLAVMQDYNKQAGNIRAWGRAVERTGILGQVGTSWARGTSWCPPGFNTDLVWPLVAELARSMGVRPRPFFAGIPVRTVERIVKTIGRCRADWRLEKQVIEEMQELAPQLTAHRHEWESTILMMRVLVLHRRAAAAIDEVDFFHANNRPVDSEWQRRLDDQAAILKELASMRREVRAHFGQRYHGDAFEEWVRDLFDFPSGRLQDCQRISRHKKQVAKKLYAR